MKLKPFLLEEWLDRHSEPPVEFNLGGSTGPVWRLRELLELDGQGAQEGFAGLRLVYSRSAGESALRDAIAEMHGVPADHVLVMIGASEALTHIFSAVAQAGANVIVPFPCFPPHHLVPEGLGLEVRTYRVQRRTDSFRLDLDEILRQIDGRTKLILVNSPHNPTGAVISAGDMAALHDVAAERGIQLVSDEVYHPIYHEREGASAARLPKATVVSDFSKAFSMSGLRLGWIVEPDAQRRKMYQTSREYVTISNSPLTEFLALLAVRHRETVLGRTRQVARTNLALLDRAIEDAGDVLRWVRPQGGMTAFPWLVGGSGGRAFCEAALECGLLLVPGDCFGLPDHVRIGFGVGSEWYPKAMERLADFLRRFRRDRRTASIPVSSG